MMILWELACLALLWSVFCRSVLTSSDTRFWVRSALLGVGAGALVGLAAPVYGWEPSWPPLVIVVMQVNMQLQMARAWLECQHMLEKTHL